MEFLDHLFESKSETVSESQLPICVSQRSGPLLFDLLRCHIVQFLLASLVHRRKGESVSHVAGQCYSHECKGGIKGSG